MALRDFLRPRTLDELIGQKKAKLAVKSMIATKTPEHLLLVGPVGTGKTSLALILARLLTGVEKEGVAEFGEPAWFHLNSAQCGNKIFVQEIVEKVAQFDVLKIFVFDEAHSITRSSQTLLLNALEKQNGKTFYIFCTTDPLMLSYALRSRCGKVFFEELEPADRVKLVERGCAKLGLGKPPTGLLDEIQRRGLAGPRSILNALDSAALGISIKDAVEVEMPDRIYHYNSAPGGRTSDLHRERNRAALARRYARLKASKLCVDCGKRKAVKGHCQCVPCRKAQAKRVERRKKKAQQTQLMAASLPGQSLFAVA